MGELIACSGLTSGCGVCGQGRKAGKTLWLSRRRAGWSTLSAARVQGSLGTSDEAPRVEHLRRWCPEREHSQFPSSRRNLMLGLCLVFSEPGVQCVEGRSSTGPPPRRLRWAG